MNDDAFARLVAEEIKNRISREQREYLNMPENWVRWQRAVKVLADNLDEQLKLIKRNEEEDTQPYRDMGQDGIKMLAELTAEFDSRRKKIERFRYHVVNRLDEVSRMIASGSSEIEERIKTVEFTRKAIERHRAMIKEFELEPTPIDVALWASLNGKWMFDEITEDGIFNSLAPND